MGIRLRATSLGGAVVVVGLSPSSCPATFVLGNPSFGIWFGGTIRVVVALFLQRFQIRLSLPSPLAEYAFFRSLCFGIGLVQITRRCGGCQRRVRFVTHCRRQPRQGLCLESFAIGFIIIIIICRNCSSTQIVQRRRLQKWYNGLPQLCRFLVLLTHCQSLNSF